MSVVTDTRTTVDVLWQDGTRRHSVPSASLVHFNSHTEEFFPGQRVVSLDAVDELAPADDGPAAAATAVPRVGIVRGVHWKDQWRIYDKNPPMANILLGCVTKQNRAKICLQTYN